MHVYNWGIIGCGNISNKFATCLQSLDNARLTAVASNSVERAESFAKQFSVKNHYTDYLSLTNDPEVDIVYIGTPHSFHYEHTLLCLENGKHVLCEKPIGINADQAGQMFEVAKQNKLFLMEAVWTRFLPAIEKMKEVICSGEIGEVHTVQADFSIIVPFNPSHRLYNKDLGGGALLDLGIYPLTFAHIVFDDFPMEVLSRAYLGETGIDETSAYLLGYEGGKTAVLSSSCRSHSPHIALAMGSKGCIEVPNFFHPNDFTINIPGKKPKFVSAPYHSLGYGHEAAEVMNCVEKGLQESPIMSWELSFKMMQLMDSMRFSWDLYYPGEQ